MHFWYGSPNALMETIGLSQSGQSIRFRMVSSSYRVCIIGSGQIRFPEAASKSPKEVVTP